MLLHVVEAAGPVDLGSDFAVCKRRVEDMGHALFLVDYLDDVRAAERSDVEGLAAGGGIECSAVQIDAAAVVSWFRPRAREIPGGSSRDSKGVRSRVKSYGAGEVISTAARMNCQSGNS